MIRILTLFSVFGCNKAGSDNIQLEWEQGETFHVAAAYKQAEKMTAEGDFDASLDGASGATFDTESWSDDLVWTYQVVETGLVPDTGDELFAFAETATGDVVSLTVMRTWLDESLNDDEAMLGADPVVYLVFREDNDRLAGLVSFTNVDGERVEAAYRSDELGKAWNALSQSQLTAAPTYLAPFSATWSNSTRMMENGGIVDSVEVEPGVTDTFFDDEVGGGMVAARYEEGQPWPTWVVSDNMDARLMSPSEVNAKRASMPYLLPEAPEDFDYRAALQSAIDIDQALTLDEETMAGGWDVEVYEEFTPWAGSWWPLSEGALVFGYNSRDTFSDRIKDQVDPIKKDMDKLSDEMRDMDDGADKDAKVEEYRAKQSELVTILVDYYNGIRQDLDGGRITVADGKMSHTEDGWSYDLDELSPMDKMALKMYFDDSMPGNNPFFLSAWEILNSYNPGGGSWWGHCNGWAAAAILTNEPTESMDVQIDGNAVELTTADQKGLLTESHYSTHSRFYGSRYYKEGDDIADLYPKSFHNLINFYIREQRVPLVFDTTAGDAVWNFPAYGANLTVNETTDPTLASKININTASVEELDTLPGIGPSKGAAVVEYREMVGPFQAIEEIKDVSGIGDATFEDIQPLITIDPFQRTFEVTAAVDFATDGVDETHVDDASGPEGFVNSYSYTLVTDANGLVLDGTWKDENTHPDFAWVPYHNASTESSNSSENPFLPYDVLIDVMGDEVERH
jgi:competence ComEA-like helix-hairpin-helix protein